MHLLSLPFCRRECLSAPERSVHTYVFRRVMALPGMLFCAMEMKLQTSINIYKHCMSIKSSVKAVSLWSDCLNTDRGGSHVFATVWDFRLVGIIGTADHWAGGREAMASHHAAAGLTWGHPALPKLPVARAGRAPFGVHDGHGRPALVVEDKRARDTETNIRNILCRHSFIHWQYMLE